MKPHRLTITISDLGSGGAQKIATSLAHYLSARGHEITVITLDDGKQDFFELSPDIKRVALDMLEKSGGSKLKAISSNFARIKALRTAIKDNRADTVLSFIAPMNALCVLATRGLHVRLVISERNDPARQSCGKLWDFLREKLYRFADVVTANSQNAIEAMKQYVPPDKLFYVVNHLDKAEFDAATSRENIILSVGRLHPQKAMPDVIRAFSQFRQNNPYWRLVILGEGMERKNLEELVTQLGLSGAVTMPGRVKDPDSYYRKAKIFVLASLHEGTSNALLEAMNYGCAPIVSDACEGALPFIRHGESGLIFPVGDIEALANTLSQLTQDSAKLELISRNAHTVLEQIHADKILPQWEALLFSQGLRL